VILLSAQEEGYPTGAELNVTTGIALNVPAMPSDAKYTGFDALSDPEILGCRETVDPKDMRPIDGLADVARRRMRAQVGAY
jgi:hypothetical protein